MAKTTGLPTESGVYCIEQVESKNLYIGSTYNIKRRLWRHLSSLRGNIHPNTHLQNSWNKHGEDKFTFRVLELCDKECLREREQYWMDSLIPIYNKSKTAISNLGQKHTLEAREKMSKSIRSWLEKGGDALRARLRESHKNSPPRSQESLDKQSKSTKEFYATEKGKLLISQIVEKRASTMTPEIRAKRANKTRETRLSKNNYKHSQETKDKLSAIHTGKSLSDDHKKKIGDASKKMWETRTRVLSEEEKEHLRNLRLGVSLSEESKAKLSESMKLSWKKRKEDKNNNE